MKNGINARDWANIQMKKVNATFDVFFQGGKTRHLLRLDFNPNLQKQNTFSWEINLQLKEIDFPQYTKSL